MKSVSLFGIFGPVAILGVLALAAPSALAYDAIDVAHGGTIAGSIRFEGVATPAAKLEATKDKDFCGKHELLNEQLVVGADKGLANVVVFLDKISKGKAMKPGKARLDNENCRYEPHVQAFVVGTDLEVSNQDPVLHNTHIRLPKSDVFNYGLPVQGQVINQKVRRKGLMKVGCDAGHTWMAAYIAVFDHPYFAVTGADGAFSLADVPPGDYKLVFWHEKLGRKTQKITVEAGGRADASIGWK